MNLVTSNQYQLTADSSPLANALHQRFAQNKVEDKAQAEKDKLNELASVIANGTPEEKQAAQQQLALLNPQASNALTSVVSNQQEQRIKAAQEQLKKNALTAFSIRDLPDITSKRTAIAKEAQQALKDGEDIAEYEKLMQIDDVDELNLALTQIGTRAMDTDKFIQSKLEPKEEFIDVKDEKGNIIGQKSTKTGKMVDHPNAVMTEEQLQQKIATSKAGAPQNHTQIVNEANAEGFTAEQKEAGKLRVQRFNTLQENALAAEEQNASLSQLENIDVSQGFGTEAKANLARVINGLGGDGEALTGVDPANVQAFNAVAGKAVLNIMSTQKGPQTDKDQDRIAKTLPKITNEKTANEFNANSLKALNFRRIEMAEFYEKIFEETGTLKGADKAWRKFKKDTPMLSDNVKNPSTGLPMFYHEFKDKLLEKNPSATNEQVINAWRELANG